MDRSHADVIPPIVHELKSSISMSTRMTLLGQLKDYRLAIRWAGGKETDVPLKPADGAIGGHQGAVRQAYGDFKDLAGR